MTACSTTGWRATSNWRSSMAAAPATAGVCRPGRCANRWHACGEVDAVVCNGTPDERLPPALAAVRHAAAGRAFLPSRRSATASPAPPIWPGAGCMRWPASAIRSAFSGPWRSSACVSSRTRFPIITPTRAADLAFAGDGVLLMTEKDAVKCAGLTVGETWVLPVEAELSPALIDLILEKLRGRQAA